MISSRSPTTSMEEWEDVWHDVFYLQGAVLWAVVHGILSTCPINSAWIWHLRKEIISVNVCRTVTCNCVKEILNYRHFVVLQEDDFRNFLFWRVFCFLFWIQQNQSKFSKFSHFQSRFLWPFLRYIVSSCWMTWFISVLNMVQDQCLENIEI